jgi:hypothetical protein
MQLRFDERSRKISALERFARPGPLPPDYSHIGSIDDAAVAGLRQNRVKTSQQTF